MTPFTSTLLTDLGIKLPTNVEAELLAHLTATLEERIGLAIFDLLDDAEADKLIDLQEQGDEQATAAWIQQNVPEYQAVVQDEFDLLISELAENAAHVTA